jgi:hypothetical protein
LCDVAALRVDIQLYSVAQATDCFLVYCTSSQIPPLLDKIGRGGIYIIMTSSLLYTLYGAVYIWLVIPLRVAGSELPAIIVLTPSPCIPLPL